MDATTLETRATGGEVVHSVVIFSRHGDRAPKLFNTTGLTALGHNQMFDSGEFYRNRYLDPSSEYYISGVSPDIFDDTQIYAAAPDQNLLIQSTQVFLQGLYPPSNSSFEILGNGTRVTTPGGGDQFPIVHTVNADSPETIWLKGSDSCQQNAQGLGQFVASQQFMDLQSSTMAFYESFQDILDGVIPLNDLSYMNAYEIFDYINVGVIHNATIAKRVSPTELKELRILADSREWALNGNITSAAPNPISIGGSTLATRLLGEITIGTKLPLPPKKMSIFVGSYETFLSFFALTSLPSVSGDFRGLPDYGSTIALELLSTIPAPMNPEDFSVRFLFRNGTDTAIREYPLFGRPRNEAVMGYPVFRSLMETIAIESVPQWCGICDSQEAFCPVDNTNPAGPTATPPPPHAASEGMKPEIAGAVGALCTLAAITIVLAVLLLLGVRVSKKKRTVEIQKSKSTSTEKLNDEV